MKRVQSLSAAIFLALLCGPMSVSQEPPKPELLPGTARKTPPALQETQPAPQSIALKVAPGTPLQVALNDEVRVRHAGQDIQGKTVAPVYAFDRIVIPAGSEVLGKITKVEYISGGKRTRAALDADFTPTRKVEVEFHELVMADGRRIPIQTTVAPGSGQILKFSDAQEKKNKIKDEAAAQVKQAKDQLHAGIQEVKAPGKVHRLERYVESQLPVHRQYLPAGMEYFAELKEGLDFGVEPMTPGMAETMGQDIPPNAIVHARLVTPLSSSTSHTGEGVDAVLSQPLVKDGRTILPQGSRLKGVVLQVSPARRMKHNGQLRITFRELVLPEGVPQKLEATLAAVQAGKDANVKLDSEGGAQATTPKTRYAATAFSLALAAASARNDTDGDGTTPGARAAGGANGFKLVGMALGVLVRSRPFGYSMGAYGAARSLYSNFLARGRDVVFPRNTLMEISVGTRPEKAALADRTASAGSAE